MSKPNTKQDTGKLEIKPIELTVMGKPYHVGFQIVTIEGRMIVTPVVEELPITPNSKPNTPKDNPATLEGVYQQITDICFDYIGVSKPMADDLYELFLEQTRLARIDEMEQLKEVKFNIPNDYPVYAYLTDRINQLKGNTDETT